MTGSEFGRFEDILYVINYRVIFFIGYSDEIKSVTHVGEFSVQIKPAFCGKEHLLCFERRYSISGRPLDFRPSQLDLDKNYGILLPANNVNLTTPSCVEISLNNKKAPLLEKKRGFIFAVISKIFSAY